MLYKFSFFQEKIVPTDKIKIAPHDLGLERGYAVFDYFRSYNGRIFRCKEHYQRFCNSAKSINLLVPISLADFEKICLELLVKNKIKEAGFRAILTGGESVINKKPTFYILCEEIFVFKPEIFAQGASVQTHEYLRYLPSAKTTNYLENLRLDSWKRQKKILELIYVWQGKVYEGATSNIFVVKNNVLITPKKDILPGVTRQVVLELAKKLKIKTEIREVTVGELKTADEIFITGTNKKVCPVTKLDAKKVGTGRVGQLTQQLLQLFDNYISHY